MALIETFAGTGAGASGVNPQYDATKFIKMGVKNGVTQYAHKTPENDAILNQLASGPLGTRGADGTYTGVWGNTAPEGQTAGQKATGNYANVAHSQNEFEKMTRMAAQELGNGGGGGDTNPPEQLGPPTGLNDAFTPGGALGGATPSGGDYLTPPKTNANVNQPLTNISQVMQNNSRVPAPAGSSTLGGRKPRPVTVGRDKPTRTPASIALNLGANGDKTGAAGKLDSIKTVGIRF